MVSGTGSRSAEVSKLFKSQYAIGKKKPDCIQPKITSQVLMLVGSFAESMYAIEPELPPIVAAEGIPYPATPGKSVNWSGLCG